MANYFRKKKMMWWRINAAFHRAAYKKAQRAARAKKAQQVNEGPRFLQIASIKEPRDSGITDEVLFEYVKKLQMKYFQAQKAMCSTCKNEPITRVFTSFKVEGLEQKVDMLSLIFDIKQLGATTIPVIGKILNAHLNPALN